MINTVKRSIMDISGNENDVQQSFRSPPRRRRSTFFERRDSIVPQALTENIDVHNSNACKKLNEVDSKQNQDLLRYQDKLLEEKDQWKTEVNHRRNKYHDLRQQYQMASKAPSRSRISYSSLSTEDIEFLKGKVNITKIFDSQVNLHNCVKHTQAMYKRALELDNVLLRHCEEKVHQITEYILENSTIEPVE